MKKFISIILTICLVAILLPTMALAADDATLALTEDWRLTSDLELNVPADTTLTIDGGNTYFIYEMGGKLINNGAGTVYLCDTFVYAQGDNPTTPLATLSKAARNVTIAAPAQDATVMTLPTVAGCTVSIKISNPVVITTAGVITPPASATTVNLVLTVTDASGNKADTGSIPVTVPAKSAFSITTASLAGGARGRRLQPDDCKNLRRQRNGHVQRHRSARRADHQCKHRPHQRHAGKRHRREFTLQRCC